LLHTRDGGARRIDLADLYNRDEAAAALRAWGATHAIPGDDMG